VRRDLLDGWCVAIDTDALRLRDGDGVGDDLADLALLLRVCALT